MLYMLKFNEEVFKFYFYFIQERMNIFWNRRHDAKTPWTQDPILQKYRFTNVYRAADRVSQYLIKNVIYSNHDFTEEDIAVRVIIFKIFNKIETWELLQERLGVLSINNFDAEKISMVLTSRRTSHPIFNNAYMMSGTHSLYNHLTYKHEKWLQMVKKELIGKGVLKRIIKSKSLEEIYMHLKTCSFIGEFLAYQYSIDLNYSPLFGFDENSFVKAGIGAIRGIKKCFIDIDKKDYERAILFTLENFDELQRKFGYTAFEDLYGRKPTLIDLQNCFCETDKYLRVKLPNLVIDNKRIKQTFSPADSPYALFFPPFWRLHWGSKTCESLNVGG